MTESDDAKDRGRPPFTALSPTQIRGREFNFVRRGYDPEEVTDFLGVVADLVDSITLGLPVTQWEGGSEPLTADLITRRSFATVRHGYDPDGVHDYLYALGAQVGDLTPGAGRPFEPEDRNRVSKWTVCLGFAGVLVWLGIGVAADNVEWFGRSVFTMGVLIELLGLLVVLFSLAGAVVVRVVFKRRSLGWLLYLALAGVAALFVGIVLIVTVIGGG